MNKLLWQFLGLSPAIISAAMSLANPAQAKPAAVTTAWATPSAPASLPTQPNLAAPEVDMLVGQGGTTEESQPSSRVTSVSQLSDVQPSDWAFQALQSLVERYGVIAGYPDGTFRGNRAMTRYEFAAALNAALDRINELIAAGQTNLVSKEDLNTLQKLQEEFSAELATLRGRVDALEARTADLKAHQFSTTTKLEEEVITGVTDAFGKNVDYNTTLSHRTRLNLETSFTGKDLLVTRLQASNTKPLSDIIDTNEGRLSFDDDSNNQFGLDLLKYDFSVNKKLKVSLGAHATRLDDVVDTVNPFFDDEAEGALSQFAMRNPIYRIAEDSAGATLQYSINQSLGLTLAYLAANANSPDQKAGLFNGDYAGIAQLNFTPNDKFNLGLTYINAYHQSSDFNEIDALGETGGALANLNLSSLGIAPRPVSSNSYGVEGSFQVSPKFAIGGWVGLTQARLIGLGDGSIWNYAVTLAFPDLGKQGNLGGIVIGMEPTLRGLDIPSSPAFNHDTSLHVEGFYKYQVNDHISLTPGIIWITAPKQNNDNPDIVVGELRTSFTF